MIHVFLFILGLCVGSFLNVVIDRIPKGESIIKGRSHCDNCRHLLSWYDLVPLVSFVILKRKCRYCQKIISWQNPLVELTTGLLFVVTYSLMAQIIGQTSFLVTFLFYLIIISGLVTIFFTDLKSRIIPDEVLLILIIVTFFFEFFFDRMLLLNHLEAGFLLLFSFLILVLITHGKGMGLGDVKLSFYMGLLLGFPKIVVALYLSFLTGAVVSLILIIGGKKRMKSTIPFGPFLVGATIVSLFYGNMLWQVSKEFLGI